MPEPFPSPLSFETMLARMLAADATADGLFFTGVCTTGIYCLPSCPARKPKPENVTFYATEDEARAAGLRPCKRCRPDDFAAGRDFDCELLVQTFDAVEREPGAFPDVESVARRAGVGLSKLHQLARRCAASTPAELLHHRRVEAAKGLLQRSRSRPTDVAFAVGYGSVSAFYARFRKETGETPGAYARRSAAAARSASEPGGEVPADLLFEAQDSGG